MGDRERLVSSDRAAHDCGNISMGDVAECSYQIMVMDHRSCTEERQIIANAVHKGLLTETLVGYSRSRRSRKWIVLIIFDRWLTATFPYCKMPWIAAIIRKVKNMKAKKEGHEPCFTKTLIYSIS